MHELSLVRSIIDIATEQSQKRGAQKVESIELDIGTLAGVEIDFFEFAWDSAVGNTVLENAERILNKIPAIAKCDSCHNEFEMKELYEPCPSCGEYLSKLIQGDELKVKSLTLPN